MEEQQRTSQNGHGAESPSGDAEQMKAGEQASQEQVAESLKEVGNQLQDLFSSIASAFRSAWNREQPTDEERRGVQDVRASFDRLERVMKQVAEQTPPQRREALEATRGASERAMSEARTATVSGLRLLNEQIQALIQRLEQETGSQPETPQPPQEPPQQLPPTI